VTGEGENALGGTGFLRTGELVLIGLGERGCEGLLVGNGGKCLVGGEEGDCDISLREMSCALMAVKTILG